MRLGIFDSGLGGLTVLGEAVKALPNADYIYFADSYYAPYGTKDKCFVKERVMTIAKFLDGFGLDALVVACNTATSIAVKELRRTYDYPIIGMEPAVKYGLDQFKKKRILVLATPLTLQEEKYHDLLNKYDVEHRVDSLALAELVELAEKQIFTGHEVERYFTHVFESYDFSKYDAIVLGCTHFVFYKNKIKEMMPKHIKVIDGNSGTVSQLIRKIEKMDYPLKQGVIRSFESEEFGIHEIDFSDVLNKVL